MGWGPMLNRSSYNNQGTTLATLQVLHQGFTTLQPPSQLQISNTYHFHKGTTYYIIAAPAEETCFHG